jgi:predicted acylesterase/phospholipase RssA
MPEDATGHVSTPIAEAPAGKSVPQDQLPALGLALSGGGVRATLFSLGVLIGLIETGCHRQLRCIASVSGGSILNAALAHTRSVNSVSSVSEFQGLASALARSLAWEGAFALNKRNIWRWLKSIALVLGRAAVPVAMFLSVLVGMLNDKLGFDPLAAVDYRNLPWGAIAWTVLSLGLVSIIASFFFSRGWLQQANYASVLQAVTDKRPLHVKEWGNTSAEQQQSIAHVLVATDLLSGEPIFFSNRFIHCRPYGWSSPGEIRTEEALYSSAAFPVVFPPKKLKLNRLKFQNGDMPGKLPYALRLVDGGVYNNLGFDWFEVLSKQKQRAFPPLWPFGEISVEIPNVEEENLVIVNAGAPSRGVNWLPPMPIARIMSVLYDNTVRPRVQWLQAQKRPVIDIEQTPLELAENLRDNEEDLKHDKDEDRLRRAIHLVRKLEGRSIAFWADFSRDTAGTATKLSSAGSRTAARLMLHGYLSGLVLFHIRFKGELPKRIRGEQYFLELVARQVPANQPVIDPVPTGAPKAPETINA